MADDDDITALFGSDDEDQPGFREDDTRQASPQAEREASPGVMPRYWITQSFRHKSPGKCCRALRTSSLQHPSATRGTATVPWHQATGRAVLMSIHLKHAWP